MAARLALHGGSGDTAAMQGLGITIEETIIGAVVGVAISLTGVGGGVLAVPALSGVVGLPASVAVGTASAYIALANLGGVRAHLRLGNLDSGAFGSLLRFGLPGVALASLGVAWWKHHAAAAGTLSGFQHGLHGLALGVVAFCALLMTIKLHPAVRLPAFPPRVTAALAVLAGALIGATGVGGGVILVPLLSLGYGLDARRTVGTSIAVSLILALVAAVFATLRHDVNWEAATAMALGSLVGVPAGSRLSVRMPEKSLSGTMVGLLILAVVVMVLR